MSLSNSDEDAENFMIFPLTDLHHDADIEDAGGDSCVGDSSADEIKVNARKAELPKKKPLMTLRERRRSKLGLDLKSEFSKLSAHVTNRLKSIDSGFEESKSPCSPGRARWQLAFRKIKSLKDPWEKFHLDQLTEEKCKRYRFSPLLKQWKEDQVVVKMENSSFNRGAMRECFRMKKLSRFTKNNDWRRAGNYVAKVYMEDVDRQVYFEDVKLQMDAKLWGEEYNRHNPPKKVDIFQMCVLEFLDRPGKPLYHLEHFIDGEYIKYNSNTGFVEDSLRFTPQAFSHFTFERSAHQLIVVDIQGVGDLWTDPQIHTVEGKDYGDGNLGTRGMALFFHSHACNSICESLSLSRFDLAPSEIASQGIFIKIQQEKKDSKHTRTRGHEEHCVSISPHIGSDFFHLMSKSRSRTISEVNSEMSDVDSVSMKSHEEDGDHSYSDVGSPHMRGRFLQHRSDHEPFSPRPTDEDEPMSPCSSFASGRRNRVRFVSESEIASDIQMLHSLSESEHSMTEQDDLSEIISPEEEEEILKSMNLRNHRASCVADEVQLRLNMNLHSIGDSVLGLVHHDVAKYHELGRFSMDDVIDWAAALFHETMAADLGIMEAIITIAKIYLGQQTDVLVGCSVDPTPENIEKGVEYMELAAQVGDRAAMLHMAQAFYTGDNLGAERKMSYKYSIDWYNKALNCSSVDEDGGYDAVMDHPPYMIKAKIAEMYLEGGHDIDKDPSFAGDLYNEAAEDAMTRMKGRLANKYYALAEEAYGQVEEE